MPARRVVRAADSLADAARTELTVAGTEYAPLERAVFKASKNNTKAPKEKHIRKGLPLVQQHVSAHERSPRRNTHTTGSAAVLADACLGECERTEHLRPP